MTHLRCHHRITVEAPVARAFMYFTPAGESHWVEGWKPTYLHPSDGRTEPGMVFTTGEGAEHTVWMLADFDRGAHRSRYLRCTPGSRLVVVEIACRALDAQTTEVEVAYTLTALTPAAEPAIAAFGAGYRAMIDGWGAQIAACRAQLLAADLR
jgi:hypothetical protein